MKPYKYEASLDDVQWIKTNSFYILYEIAYLILETLPCEMFSVINIFNPE